VSATNGKLAAAILAGGGGGDKVAAAGGVACKALVDMGGEPMVNRVVRAALAAELIEDVVVVEGPGKQLSAGWAEPLARVATAPGEDFLDTVQEAARALPDADRILLVTVDIPMVTAEELDGFVRSCIGTQAELSYAMISAEDFDKEFPGRGKTVAHLREGHFTGGSVACVSRQFVVEQGETIARTFDRRKSKLALAQLFGLSFVAKMLVGQLSVAELEKRGSEMLGGRLHAVRTSSAGLAFDVDDAGDMELAREFVRKHEQG